MARKDKIYSVGGQVSYEFRRNISLLLNVSHDKRDSNRDTLDYDANVYGVGLRIQF